MSQNANNQTLVANSTCNIYVINTKQFVADYSNGYFDETMYEALM